MNLYKRVTGLIFMFLLLISVSGTYAQEALPHFFPEGVRKNAPNAAAEQWEEWARYANATINNLANEQGRSFLIGESRFVEKTYFGQKVKVVFDQHIKDGDRTRYTSFGGQYYITEKQFQELVSFTDKAITDAVEIDYSFWSSLEKDAVSIAFKADGRFKTEQEFREYLDRKDHLNPSMTFRELRHIPPVIERKDFVPFRELHVGLTPEYPSVLGVAWLNAGIVYYTPVAMIRDYLMDTSVILAHEFVHTNKKLQGIPLVWGFDAETMASVPDMLVTKDYTDMWLHGYADDFRELIWVYFRFDFEQARKEVVKVPMMGNFTIDRQMFDDYSKKLEMAKTELRKAFKRVVAEFYSTPVWWTALNDKLVDNNSVFRVMMASMYNPTLLGGEETTTKWAATNEYKHKRWADEAFAESGSTASEGGMDMADTGSVEKVKKQRAALLILSQIQSVYGVSDEEVSLFLKFHKVSPEELFTWGPKKLKKAIEDFIINQRRE